MGKVMPRIFEFRSWVRLSMFFGRVDAGVECRRSHDDDRHHADNRRAFKHLLSRCSQASDERVPGFRAGDAPRMSQGRKRDP